jgi:inner membrane protein
LWAKVLAIGGAVLLLALALARIDFLVDERRSYQREAEHSVQQSIAGAQTLLGPVLQRPCVETWETTVGEGRERRTETQRREFVLRATPARLELASEARTELRYRGLFKVNGYAANVRIAAAWTDPAALQALAAQRKHAGSRLECGRVRAWLAASDVRGLRSATLAQDSRPLAVRPGTGHATYAGGLHAELEGDLAPEAAPAAPLALALTLELVGTGSFAVVPAAEAVSWTARADWPHPSFGGRFLPQQREVSETGYRANWLVSSLASAAPQQVLRSVPMCGAEGATGCLDTLAVSHLDPVNPYSLADRAIKYGLLFVLLTFTAVGLAEALGGEKLRRVHPVQYALVGLVLAIFFLLLLSLSEHMAFGAAYAVASAACAVLLAVYARYMFGRVRDGLWFGAGIGLLYGLLYLLLLREQTALVLGSVGLFAALAAVMLLTRHVDWYRLAPQPRDAGAGGARAARA